MADKIIIKNTAQEANLNNVQAADVLNGELLLVREADKERLYCKNSTGEISPIHRFWNAGEFERIEPNVIEIQKEDTVAGDVCAWDGNSKRFFRFVDEGANDNIKNYTPIGVTVVPASHTDDGTARVISLAAMDYNNPDNGTTEGHNGISWGGSRYNISILDSKTMFPCISTDYRNITAETQSIVEWNHLNNNSCFIPSDQFNTYPNPYDEGTFYMSRTTTVTGRRAGPSPYLTGGLKNDIYYDTSDTHSILTDMDGRVNSKVILDVDNSGSTDWQTASTIANTTNIETIHPAAQCCWRYHTVGTSQGDWYLPSAGELGYLASRWKAINVSIEKVISSGFQALAIPAGGNKWHSSTEYSTDHDIELNLSSYDCSLGWDGKAFSRYVRAFLAV